MVSGIGYSVGVLLASPLITFAVVGWWCCDDVIYRIFRVVDVSDQVYFIFLDTELFAQNFGNNFLYFQYLISKYYKNKYETKMSD